MTETATRVRIHTHAGNIGVYVDSIEKTFYLSPELAGEMATELRLATYYSNDYKTKEIFDADKQTPSS